MMRISNMVASILIGFALISPQAHAQPRVDSRNMYERILVVVSFEGAGMPEDPRRSMYAPAPATLKSAVATRTGIIGYTHVLSDDGKYALVEFIARDRSAFQAILADKSVKCFVKGRDKLEDAVAEFKKYKKNVDVSGFGVRMP
jgi:hypothetical protein